MSEKTDDKGNTPDPSAEAETRVKALIDESVKGAVASALAEFTAGLPKPGSDTGPAPRRTHEPEKKTIMQTLFGNYS